MASFDPVFWGAIGAIVSGVGAGASGITKAMLNIQEMRRRQREGAHAPVTAGRASPGQSASASSAAPVAPRAAPVPPQAVPSSPMPAPAPVPAQTGNRPGPWVIRYFNYPRLGVISAVAVVLFIAGIVTANASADHGSAAYAIGSLLITLGVIAALGSAIYTWVKAGRLRRWGWLIGMVVLALCTYALLAGPVFSLFAPTERRPARLKKP